jgi:antitoxin component YwqK of YwqJK toxin-antitoxin module
MECKAITNTGIQCSREALDGSKYCWQHQNYDMKNNYFQNIPLLQNTLLTYFSTEQELKNINKQFQNLEYEKYLTPIEPHGIETTYYPDSKMIEEKTTYINGIKNGLYEKYYPNGQLYIKANYKNRRLDGLYQKFYQNGKLEFEKNYVDGKFDGPYIQWHDNGNLIAQYTYKNNEYDGSYDVWYGNGQLWKHANYKNRKLDGLYEERTIDGKVFVRYNYVNGVRREI